VCGVANNQLAEPRHGEELRARGIVYAPDFVVNAGGVIASARVIFARVDRDRATEQILALYDTILSILTRADASGRAPCEIAEDLARERLEAGAQQGV
jgi:leucine dehydrogenase